MASGPDTDRRVRVATDISTQTMLGRDDLLALAERRLTEVRGGRGHLLLLAGEAGIGKTRLLHAIQELAGPQGFALWTAGAFPQDVELSAGLLLDLGHVLARSASPEVAALGQRLVSGLEDVPAAVGGLRRRPPPAAAPGARRRRDACLDGR